jgi:hypothetical protein
LNWWKKLTLLFLLITVPASYITAQSTTNKASTFDSTGLPQWVKDVRRWEIVAFGSIPFTIFFATFGMDMYRWKNANGMDFSTEGRRYAPWPMKSAGGVPMSGKEQEMVFLMAAGLSVTIAFADFAIVQIKRHKARKRAEALPAGTTIITRTPMPEEPSEEQDGADIDEGSPDSSSAQTP